MKQGNGILTFVVGGHCAVATHASLAQNVSDPLSVIASYFDESGTLVPLFRGSELGGQLIHQYVKDRGARDMDGTRLSKGDKVCCVLSFDFLADDDASGLKSGAAYVIADILDEYKLPCPTLVLSGKEGSVMPWRFVKV